MIFAIAAMLMQAVPALSVPGVSVDIEGRQTQLDPSIVSHDDKGIVVAYGEPKDTIPMTVHDGTNGVLDTSVPTISFDQPMALRDSRTGLVTVYPDVIMHRTPTVVVKGSDTARSAYEIGKPKTPAEAAVGVCTPKASK